MGRGGSLRRGARGLEAGVSGAWNQSCQQQGGIKGFIQPLPEFLDYILFAQAVNLSGKLKVWSVYPTTSMIQVQLGEWVNLDVFFLGVIPSQGGITRGFSNHFCDTFGNLPLFGGDKLVFGVRPFCCITDSWIPFPTTLVSRRNGRACLCCTFSPDAERLSLQQPGGLSCFFFFFFFRVLVLPVLFSGFGFKTSSSVCRRFIFPQIVPGGR